MSPLAREQHCTHLSFSWCDCDWCRYIRTKEQEQRHTETWAFERGWLDAASGDAAASLIEVAIRYPALSYTQACLYLNGAEDGAKGDRFRLDGPLGPKES